MTIFPKSSLGQSCEFQVQEGNKKRFTFLQQGSNHRFKGRCPYSPSPFPEIKYEVHQVAKLVFSFDITLLFLIALKFGLEGMTIKNELFSSKTVTAISEMQLRCINFGWCRQWRGRKHMQNPEHLKI